MKKRKLLEKVLLGSKNIQFNEIVTLVEAFGFTLSRINGSHHILPILIYQKSLIFKIKKDKSHPIKYVNF